VGWRAGFCVSAKLLVPDCAVTPAALQLDFELPPTATAPQLTGQVPPGFAGLTALRRWALPRMNLQVRLSCLWLYHPLLGRRAVQRGQAAHTAAPLRQLKPGMSVGIRGP
jgi:hypothetical protein